MAFKDFANSLKPIIGGSSNTVDFTRNLFVIMIGENNSTIIEDLSDESYKAYYNGRTTINNIAKKISPYVDPENFVAYLDQFGDSVSQRICDTFSSKINDINLQNVNEKVAYYFDEIIKTAASSQRKSTKQSANDETTSNNITSNEKGTTIQNQINVVQNGNNNMNLTNTGTIEFNFGGANK